MALSEHDKRAWLRKVPIFAACTDEELARIAERAVEIDFRPGRQITRKGDVGTGFYLIVEGEAHVLGGGKTVATFGPGQFFGELSLLDRAPRSATVVAATATKTLGIASWDFLAILEEHHSIALKMLQEVAHRLRVTMDSPVA